MTKDEALRLALEALESHLVWFSRDTMIGKSMRDKTDHAITAIKATLEAKDEPVAYINVEQRKLEWAKYVSWDTPTVVNLPKIPLYTTPTKRTWVGLTDEERGQVYADWRFNGGNSSNLELCRAIEAKLKEKNT